MSTTKRRGLGRGLDALLGPAPTATDVLAPDDPRDIRLAELRIEDIVPNPEQPRTAFDPEALAELRESIRLHGLLQPIVVEPGDSGRYRLVAGERRLRACREAGLGSIPAVVRPASESNRHALELALIENLQRADLNPLDEAAAFVRLSDTFGLTHEAIGRRVGRSRPAVANLVRLLGLPPEVQNHLREGRLTAGHGRALLGLGSVAAQLAMTERVLADGLSVRETEAAVNASAADGQRRVGGDSTLDPQGPAHGGRAASAPHGHGPSATSLDDAALARGMEDSLGTPVRLERRRRGGRIIVDFYDDAQLDELYSRLGGRPL